jgi:MSHA biogenesis protein MshN
VSVINKMLRELDRRHALPDSASGHPSVRVVPPARRSDAFWITLALAAFAALGSGAWVAYEVRTQPLATPLAVSRPPSPVQPVVAAQAVRPLAPPKEEPPLAPAAQPAPELFKLADSIEVPITRPSAPKELPKPLKVQPVPARPVQVSKVEHPLSTAEEANMRFYKGVERLNQGRASAAAQDFASALALQPSHEPARQALVAMRLEQADLDGAERLLKDGMALSPSNAQFATVLARIRVEHGDYDGAAEILLRTREAGAADSEHQLLLATVLQRLGRDGDAIAAFEQAAQVAELPPSALVAAGISYENVGRKAQALHAYRQSLLANENSSLRSYAENRIRALN